MQQYKKLFSDDLYKGTFANIQKCLRLNDLDEIGDGTHHLSFDMIGFFSFREYTLKQSVDFMMKFCFSIGIIPDYVTIHPDKFDEWLYLYNEYPNIEIRKDDECKWSDGLIGGYCTEFYKDDIEIGNIVNTLGTCIDVGFGLQRLMMVLGKLENKTRLQILEETSLLLIDNGINISHYKSGYVLKKIITECVLNESSTQHPFYDTIRRNQIVIYKNYLNLSKRNSNRGKPDSYWLETMGFDKRKENLYISIRNKYE